MKSSYIARAGVLALAVAASSCSSAVREGTGSSYLIISKLEAASGAEPDKLQGTLFSDVLTVVDDVPSIYADPGVATFRLGLKDPGTAATPLEPTQSQFITLNRYTVRFTRTDGRNTQGVDVPYGFEGAATGTVAGDGGSISFELVRHTAKKEAPLLALQSSPVTISTIAEVTFYGRDQNGREVSVVGRISVDFGNFGDPK